MGRRWLGVWVLSGFVLSVGVGCARKTMSARDARRQQMTNDAHAKRLELRPAAGLYRGVLTSDDGVDRDGALNLEIKDSPNLEPGQVDPVPVPMLAGALQLRFGPVGGDEFFGFEIQKSDYDAKRETIQIVAANTVLKEIVLSLEKRGGRLTGQWTSPSLGVEGDVEMTSGAASNESPTLRGEYGGVLSWTDNVGGQGIAQRATLSLATSQVGGDSLSIRANARIVVGGPESKEVLVYDLDQVTVNPITRQIAIKGANADVYFLGTIGRGRIDGTWHASYSGKAGRVVFTRDAAPALGDGVALLSPLTGPMRGRLVDTHPETNLPERLMVHFRAFPDLARPGALGVSGFARLYFGDFSGNEYQEIAFDRMEYNVFRRTVVASSTGVYPFTLEGTVTQDGLTGRVLYGSYGEVGRFDVSHVGTEEP